MNITYTFEELKAIARNDFEVFDHNLTRYDLIAAISQTVGMLSKEGTDTQLRDEIEDLKGQLRIKEERLMVVKEILENDTEVIRTLQEDNARLKAELDDWKK